MSVHVSPPSVVVKSLPLLSVPAKPCFSSRKSVLRTTPAFDICTCHVAPPSPVCRMSPSPDVSQPFFALGHDMSSYLPPMGRWRTSVHSIGTDAAAEAGAPMLDCLGPQTRPSGTRQTPSMDALRRDSAGTAC